MVKRFDVNDEDHSFIQKVSEEEGIKIKEFLQLAFAIGYRENMTTDTRYGSHTVSSSVDDFDGDRILRLLTAERKSLQDDEEAFTEIMKYVFGGLNIIKTKYIKDNKIDFLKILKDYNLL